MIGDIYKADTFSNTIRSFASKVDLDTNDTLSLLKTIKDNDKIGVNQMLTLEGQLKTIREIYESNPQEEIGVLYAKKQLEYIDSKGDLISFRKTILGFIQGSFNKFPINEDIKEILSELMNGYSYEETLYNLGFDNKLNQLHLDKDTLTYK